LPAAGGAGEHAGGPESPGRLRVLVVADYFLPGFMAGGPVRTIDNLARLLSGEVELAVLTRDRDVHDDAPYAGLPTDRWTERAGVAVRYTSPRGIGLRGLRRVLSDTPHDVLYLNSALSPLTRRILALRRMGAIPARPTVLAPRGELSPGALHLGAAKKRAFLGFARLAGLFRGITWQATSALERGEIAAVLGPGARVEVAPNPSLPPAPAAPLARPPKRPGAVRLVFLSRFSRKKNLLAALELLRGAEGEVVLDLHGIVEDEPYWALCLEAIAALPPNVACAYHGPVPPERVEAAFAASHFFLFPTLGENFGHVIAEALRAGCPVLLSDRTPWRGLAAARAGWDVPLEDRAGWSEALRQAIAMDGPTWEGWARGAQAYAAAALSGDDARQAHLRLFCQAAAPAE
jgi:glycosyltransferase involved in cell wall biosynthesis